MSKLPGHFSNVECPVFYSVDNQVCQKFFSVDNSLLQSFDIQNVIDAKDPLNIGCWSSQGGTILPVKTLVWIFACNMFVAFLHVDKPDLSAKLVSMWN